MIVKYFCEDSSEAGLCFFLKKLKNHCCRKTLFAQSRTRPGPDPDQRFGSGTGALQGDFPSSRWRCEHRKHLPSTPFFSAMAGDGGVLFLGVAILEPDPKCGRVFPPPRDRWPRGGLEKTTELSVHSSAGRRWRHGRHRPGESPRRAAGGTEGSPGAGGVLGEKRAGGLRR